MRIAIVVEGATESAVRSTLIDFLRPRLLLQMPQLHFIPQNGRIPKQDKLKRVVENLLRDHNAVIALTDVYTGTTDFTEAADAKTKMRAWAGNNNDFHPHAAQHDF